MPGVETSLPLMLTQAKLGKCTIAQVANWMSNAPVKAYGIPNIKEQLRLIIMQI